MCTVTFIPAKDSYFITSNRDEKVIRKQAIPPETYFVDGRKIIYPKDADAGGSWIAMDENGNAAVLLNGAFKKHISQPAYRKSRGIIFLEIFNAALPVTCFEDIDLREIEPFTIIILKNELYECRWDGNKKYSRKLLRDKPYIWSSATLYDEAVVKKREHWFDIFLDKHSCPAQDDILKFHQFTGDGDKENDLQMNRNGLLFTVSITGIEIEPGISKMKYLDLQNESLCRQEVIWDTRYGIQDAGYDTNDTGSPNNLYTNKPLN